MPPPAPLPSFAQEQAFARSLPGIPARTFPALVPSSPAMVRAAWFALPLCTTFLSCHRDSPSPAPASAPASVSSALTGPCAPLAPDSPADWAVTSLPFGTVRIPASWRPVPAPGGFEFRDPARHRRVFFSEVVFPSAAGLSPQQAIDRVAQRVRPKLAASDMKVDLGPLLPSGSPAQPATSFLSTAASRSIFSGIAARSTTDSGVRLLNATYEEDIPGVAASCIQSHGTSLLDRVEISPAPVGDGQGPAAASLVRFTPAALTELKRQMQPDDVVWIAASRSRSDIDFHLELRPPNDLPPDALRDSVDKIPVAVDRASLTAVDGATIDFSQEGGGFIVQNPSAK